MTQDQDQDQGLPSPVMTPGFQLPLRPRPTSSNKPLPQLPIIDVSDPPSPESESLHPPLTPKAIFSDRTPRQSTRCPESLHFPPNSLARNRSPTQSSISSVLSATLPDSSSARLSFSSLASPISTTYASEVERVFGCGAPSSRSSSRVRRGFHRKRPSIASCSTGTFLNDETDDDEDTDVWWWGSKKRDTVIRVGIETVEEEDDIVSSQNETAIHDDTVDPPPEILQKFLTEERDPWNPLSNSAASGCDSGSDKSDDFTPENTEAILNFTLQTVYGIDLQDANISPATCHQIVQRFVQDLGQHVWQAAPADGQSVTHGSGGSVASSNSTPAGSAGDSQDSQRGGKRKKQAQGQGQGQGQGDEEGDDMSDGEGSGYLPVKRPRPSPKEDENIRLSCPYRKRNPHRFNVRDHHSCAMTYFPKFAELRQHIVKQHKRDDPSAFVCDRCNRDFLSRKELRDHQRLPKEQMCDTSDHDPESGIDGPTSNKLLSRKRASGASHIIQWREIWNILFPDDEDASIHPYHFIPVIEHFELSTHYLTSFKSLQSSLYDKISNPTTLDTLATKFQQCFIESIDRCIVAAQDMPYTNRSNRRSEQQNSHHNHTARIQGTQSLGLGVTLMPRKPAREVLPRSDRPDSGVVIDDGSDESGSVLGGTLAHKDSATTVRDSTGSSVIQSQSQLYSQAGDAKLLPAWKSEDAVPLQPSMMTTTATVATLTAAAPGSDEIFDETLMDQLQALASDIDPGVMDPAMVQAWSNSVYDGTAAEPEGQFSEQFLATMAPSNWAEAVYRTDFNVLGEGFSGFHGK